MNYYNKTSKSITKELFSIVKNYYEFNGVHTPLSLTNMTSV